MFPDRIGISGILGIYIYMVIQSIFDLFELVILQDVLLFGSKVYATIRVYLVPSWFNIGFNIIIGQAIDVLTSIKY